MANYQSRYTGPEIDERLRKAGEAVLTEAQSLDASKQAQARENIGAASSAAVDGKYTKPSGGIPASDLASGVQASLGKADTAYQKPQAGIPATDLADKYAGSPSAGGPAFKALGIPYGAVDANSTATDIKATVDNFPETLVAGVCAYIRNDVIASASGFTLNINGTGALPVYQSLADASRVTTLFSAASTFLFVYNPTRVEGGCWDLYYGYNSNDNTVGYNLRTDGGTAVAAAKFYRYRLLFTAPDGQSLVPSNTSSSTSSTAAKTVNQAKIDPFAPIWYYSTTTAINAGSSASASYLWMQYSAIPLGYAFNRTGAALTMTARYPVYLKCAPQSDGSAIMDADTPIVQALPSTEDGKIYIFLGYAESEVNITLYYWHPVYYFKDGAIRQWTNAAATSNGVQDVTVGGTSVVSGGVAEIPAIPEEIDTVNVTVDNATGTPSASGSVSGGVLSLEFHNLKGATGATGATGPQGPTGPQGAQGNTGSSVDYPYELVNNLTTDDATKGLTAAMGVQLEGEIRQLDQEAGDCILVDGFGATPDGETDCTDAIMEAVEAARASGKRLVFGDGTYLTRKSIVMTSGMRVEGSGKTEIKNASAVLDDEAGNAGNGYCAIQRTAEAAAAGATSIKVADVTGLAVGQEITIIDPSIPSYQETSADIVSISGGGGSASYPELYIGSYNAASGIPSTATKMLRTDVFDASGTIYITAKTPVGGIPQGLTFNTARQIFTWNAQGTYLERMVVVASWDVETAVSLGSNVAKIAIVYNASTSARDISSADLALFQGTLAVSDTPSGGENAYTVKFTTSRFTADGTNGGLKSAIATNAYVTTDFSIIKTVDTKAANDVSIRKLKLSPCGSNSEPYIYLISPINQTHQTGQPQGKFVVEDVEINGSVHDGISAQGSGDVFINRCYVHDCRFKAIHFGTSCDRVNITDNRLEDCGNSDSAPAGGSNGGGGAIYFCVNNHRVIMTNNHIGNCKQGVFGFDWRGNGETDTDSIISNNTFTGCSLYGVFLKGGMRMVVSGNVFRSFAGAALPIYVTADTNKCRGCSITGNAIGGFGASTAEAAIKVGGAADLAITGNTICALAPNSNSDTVPSSLGHVCDIVVAGSSRVLVAGNVTDGSIDISDSGNTGVVKGNNIEAS